MRLRAAAFIDGFNFYYRSLRQGSHKWLNLQQLLADVFPEHDFVAIKYFSADVKDRQRRDAAGTTTSNRQQLYLRALRSTPMVEVIKGRFLVTKKFMPIHPVPATGPIPKIKVVNTEEKGSDVNLATELLLGAFHNTYDVAVVLSLDSDLERPIQEIARNFRKPVHLAMGGSELPGREMRRASEGRFRRITDEALERAQFPETVTLPDGSTVFCPESWKADFVPSQPTIPPNSTVRAVVRTVRGRFEQGEIEITTDHTGRLVQEAGQPLIVQRLPIFPSPISTVSTHVLPTPGPSPEIDVNKTPVESVQVGGTAHREEA
ncbi:hypothetical protein GCM10017784_11500 [Deinococcus indicus]|nr:hypothetical protein GCM10017784_11500 [Deinococcus indicus]